MNLDPNKKSYASLVPPSMNKSKSSGLKGLSPLKRPSLITPNEDVFSMAFSKIQEAIRDHMNMKVNVDYIKNIALGMSDLVEEIKKELLEN